MAPGQHVGDEVGGIGANLCGNRRNGYAHTVATIFAPSVRQRIYAFIATSVRFFAFIFLMTLRTWTFTVLKHMFNS